MEKKIFREKSLESISSPEKLDNYIHVVGPGVWTVLLAIILLIIGFFVWASIGTVTVYDRYDVYESDGNNCIDVNKSTADFINNIGCSVLVDDDVCKVVEVTQDSKDVSKYTVILDYDKTVKDKTVALVEKKIKPINYLFN